MAKRRHNKDLPAKTDPAEFGGGRRRGYYTQAEIEQVMCCVAGCGRFGFASWSACYDGNVSRVFCAEHDIELNWQVALWTGDPDAVEKIETYANSVQARLDRQLDISRMPFLVRAA